MPSYQAHRLSTPDMSQSPATTTTPDDVFYILKIVLSRLLSTGSVETVRRTIELLRDIIERDYAGMIKKKLDDVYRTAGNIGTGSRGERGERESRSAFIVSCHRLGLISIVMIEDFVERSGHFFVASRAPGFGRPCLLHRPAAFPRIRAGACKNHIVVVVYLGAKIPLKS